MHRDKRGLLRPQIAKILAPVGLIAVGMLFATALFWTPARLFAASPRVPRAQAPLLDAIATPVPGGPGYIMIAPGSFHADSGGNDFAIDQFNRYVTQGSGIVNLHAPVQLPHGAKVTRLIYYCSDNTAYYTYADLTRSSPADYGTRFDNIYVVMSVGDSGNQTIVDDTPAAAGAEVVDNSRYSYLVHLHFSDGSGLRAYGVRIDYEYGDFLPAVLKDATH